MGWKTTIDITRAEAIQAIKTVFYKRGLVLSDACYNVMSDDELKDVMYQLGIGDDVDKPYYSYNFNIC